MTYDELREFNQYMNNGNGLLFLAEKLYLEFQNRDAALVKYNSAFNMYELAELFARECNEHLLCHRAKERKDYCDKRIKEINALKKIDANER